MRETQHERPGASLQTAALDANPGVPPGDVREALRVLRDSLESFDDGPADRTLERLLGVFASGTVLRDVVMPYCARSASAGRAEKRPSPRSTSPQTSSKAGCTPWPAAGTGPVHAGPSSRASRANATRWG
jgi:hypothetical protein